MKKLLIVLITLTSVSAVACDYYEAIEKVKKKLTFSEVNQDKQMSVSSRVEKLDSFDWIDGVGGTIQAIKEVRLKVYINNYVVLSDYIYVSRQAVKVDENCSVKLLRAEHIEVKDMTSR